MWHRLSGWPDAVEGLTRLKKNYIIATLSNGNVSLLVEMAKFAGLPWDTVFGADLFHHYQPDPEVYLGAVGLLSMKPNEVMMCAAHPPDLNAAKALGLRTGYVPRPLEGGPGRKPAPASAETLAGFDVVAKDFVELAAKMEASELLSGTTRSVADDGSASHDRYVSRQAAEDEIEPDSIRRRIARSAAASSSSLTWLFRNCNFSRYDPSSD